MKANATSKKAKVDPKRAQKAEQQMIVAKAKLDKQMQSYKLAREKAEALT